VPSGTVRVQRVLVHERVRMAGSTDRIDPDTWRPLITSFQELYGLGGRVRESTPATIAEHTHRGPRIARSRTAARSAPEGGAGVPAAATGRP
jgi:hypothetical protein